ncbi:MAG: MmoB/DmpM family protein [Actinomycetota bacterium]|nr:MmoB/DmpM family protein [Actinomycetota bacterium]
MAERRVGPVLRAGRLGEAVAAAVSRGDGGVEIEDRGGYLRVTAPPPCVVRRDAVEEELGEPFALPGDLERVMPSFRGRLVLSEEEARWE